MVNRGTKPIGHICKKCKSGNTYVIKKEIICRKCGHRSRRKD